MSGAYATAPGAHPRTPRNAVALATHAGYRASIEQMDDRSRSPSSNASSIRGADGFFSERRSSNTRQTDATEAFVHRSAISSASHGAQHDGSPTFMPGTYLAVSASATCAGGRQVTKQRRSSSAAALHVHGRNVDSDTATQRAKEPAERCVFQEREGRERARDRGRDRAICVPRQRARGHDGVASETTRTSSWSRLVEPSEERVRGVITLDFVVRTLDSGQQKRSRRQSYRAAAHATGLAAVLEPSPPFFLLPHNSVTTGKMTIPCA